MELGGEEEAKMKKEEASGGKKGGCKSDKVATGVMDGITMERPRGAWDL